MFRLISNLANIIMTLHSHYSADEISRCIHTNACNTCSTDLNIFCSKCFQIFFEYIDEISLYCKSRLKDFLPLLVLYSYSLFLLVSVSRSHGRVPFTRQTGLRFLRTSATRRMLIFAIYTAGNLTYIIIWMSWPHLKSRFLADLESSRVILFFVSIINAIGNDAFESIQDECPRDS